MKVGLAISALSLIPFYLALQVYQKMQDISYQVVGSLDPAYWQHLQDQMNVWLFLGSVVLSLGLIVMFCSWAVNMGAGNDIPHTTSGVYERDDWNKVK